MSLLHPEEARLCKVCEFKWFAEKYSAPHGGSGSSNFYALGGHHGAAAASAVKSASKTEAKAGNYQRWRYCPNCGSKKVKTVGKKGFVPSGSIRPSNSSTTTSGAPPPPPPKPSETTTCSCGFVLNPAWRFCPMCGSVT